MKGKMRKVHNHPSCANFSELLPLSYNHPDIKLHHYSTGILFPLLFTTDMKGSKYIFRWIVKKDFL